MRVRRNATIKPRVVPRSQWRILSAEDVNPLVVARERVDDRAFECSGTSRRVLPHKPLDSEKSESPIYFSRSLA